MAESPQFVAESELGSQTRSLRRTVYLVVILVATSVSAAAISVARPHLSANDRSRWCTVWALVERGTYQIDEIIKDRKWQTIDKVRHEEHFYSTKPPLFPTLVAGGYWALKAVAGWTIKTDYGIDARVTRTILVFVNLIPMLVSLVLIAAIVERYARTDWTRVFVLAAAAFGTLLTPLLITLNNHTVTACSILFAVYPAMRIVCDGERKRRYFLISGFFAAFACCTELPAALFGVALFGILFRRARTETLKFFVPAALVPLVAFFYTNYLATGGWKPFYMYYGTEKYLYVVDGKTSYWADPKGLDKGGDSPLVYFMHCTIGHHGILSLSPVFLISLASWVTIRRWRDFALRPWLWLGLGLTVGVLGFYLTRTQNYNYGGNTCGLRWAFWLIPFWLVSMIPALDRWSSRRWFQVAASILLAVSVFSATYPLSTNPPNPWRPPWLFTLMERSGWIDYSD